MSHLARRLALCAALSALVGAALALPAQAAPAPLPAGVSAQAGAEAILKLLREEGVLR